MTDAVPSEELYFKYLNILERESGSRIDSFRSNGGSQWTTKLGQIRIRPSRIRILLYRCRANSRKDDGKFAGEYCCNGCGQLVEVLQHNDR